MPEKSNAAVTVLVVEDEGALAEVVAGYLRREGFEVEVALDGLSGLARAREIDPDLVVLDVMLPGLDGIEVCRQLRSFSDAYVMMLTARGDETDTVVGLSVGADDYVIKPFSPRELVARAKALLRRPRQAEAVDDGVRHFGDLVLNLEGRRVSVDGTEVALTRTEFDLLAALAERPAAVLSRQQLVTAVWGPVWFGDDHVVDVHIGALRRKLGDSAEQPRWIRTVRGVGYGLAVTA